MPPAVLPFFSNRLDGLPPSRLSLDIAIGDILGVPLLQAIRAGRHDESSSSSSQYLWDLVVLSNYMIDPEWLLSEREGGLVLRPSVVKAMIVLCGERDDGRGGGCSAHVPEGFRRGGVDDASIGKTSAARWGDITFGPQALPPQQGQLCIITPHLPVPFGTHHTKACVCVGREFIRVSIFTANFVYADWRCKNQGVYVQDFPLKKPVSATRGDGGSSFEYDLIRYFTATGWRGCDAVLSRYDYSSAMCHLVASIPGYHSAYAPSTAPQSPSAPTTKHWGMWHLRHQLRHFLPAATPPVPEGGGDGVRPTALCAPSSQPQQQVQHALTWQYTSQGSLTDAFVETLAHTMLLDASSATQSVSTEAAIRALDTVAIVMPTITEVRRSTEGWRGGVSIPIPAKNLFPFVNNRLHRWSSKLGESGGWVAPISESAQNEPPRLAMLTFGRHRYMPHIKTYVKYRKVVAPLTSSSSSPLATPATATRPADYVLVTSSNLSRAAWGDVQKKGTQLMIRSYELGVLFTSRRGGAAAASWSVRGIPTPRDNRIAALEEGLHRIVISSKAPRRVDGSDDNNDDADDCVLYLPFDATNPVPYDSTAHLLSSQHAPPSPLSRSPPPPTRDVPWVVDVPHEGYDVLGQRYAEDVMGGYSHYGVGARRASLLTPEGAAAGFGPPPTMTLTHGATKKTMPSAAVAPPSGGLISAAEAAVRASNQSVMVAISSQHLSSQQLSQQDGRNLCRSGSDGGNNINCNGIVNCSQRSLPVCLTIPTKTLRTEEGIVPARYGEEICASPRGHRHSDGAADAVDGSSSMPVAGRDERRTASALQRARQKAEGTLTEIVSLIDDDDG